MIMSPLQSVIMIAAVVLGTLTTRFLPFLLFPANRTPPKVVQYLGQVLPYAVMGLLVVYSLKDISLFSGTHGIPEAIALLAIILVHLWKKNMLLSIALGTILYMVLVQFVF